MHYDKGIYIYIYTYTYTNKIYLPCLIPQNGSHLMTFAEKHRDFLGIEYIEWKPRAADYCSHSSGFPDLCQ